MQFRIAAMFVAALIGLGACRTAPPIANGPAADGSFRVECVLSHRAQVDPIVAPGRPSGTCTISSVTAPPERTRPMHRCSRVRRIRTLSGDKAGYWVPTLIGSNGTIVPPERSIFYYRNRPTAYSATVAFPPNFRMIAGGSFPNSYWTCDGEQDTAMTYRRNHIPNCGPGGKIKLHVFFPSCWEWICVSTRAGSSEPCRVRSRQWRCDRRY